MVELSACAIVKNEGAYIYEWLSFHYAVGVERFFIYDNDSTDNTLAEIRRWPRRDIVTIMGWPSVPSKVSQFTAYEHMIFYNRDTSRWCAFIDCDEFLYPRSALSIRQYLDTIAPYCCGLYVHWLMFGSSGHLTRQPGLVTETFVRRGVNNFPSNRIGKTIVKLSAATGVNTSHLITCRGRLINDAGDEVSQETGAIHTSSSHDFIAINHYFTKSLEEWRLRRTYGRADKRPSDEAFVRLEGEFHRHDVNEVLDTRAAEIMQQAKTLFY